MMGDVLNQTDFLAALRQMLPSLSWQLRYKLLDVFVDSLSLSEKVQILSEAVGLLRDAPFKKLFGDLIHCYSSFNDLGKQNAQKEDMVVEDASATAKMEKEPLDSGMLDKESELVAQGEILSQQLRNYLSVMDVVARIFTPETGSTSLIPFLSLTCSQISSEISQTTSSCLVDTLLLLYSLASECIQAETIRISLIAGVEEAITAVLPSAQSQLTSLWSVVLRSLTLSQEVALSASKLLWSWAQLAVQSSQYSDSMNPVCFEEQISPLLALLSSDSAETLIQVINTIACLLGPLTPSSDKEKCVTEVCRQVVHVLDSPQNASNAEILGCVLDFMMTMCDVREAIDV